MVFTRRALLVAALVAALGGFAASPASAAVPIATSTQVVAYAGSPQTVYLDAYDPQGDALTFTVDTAPAHGSLTDDCSDGVCTYTADAGYTGADAVAFHATDAEGPSTRATLSITVAPDVPQAYDGSTQSFSGEPADVALDGEDPQRDPLAFTVVDPPAHGALTDCTQGFCSYTSDDGWTGADTFTFRVSDGGATSDLATYTVAVAAPPVPRATRLQASASGARAVTLSWTRPDGTLAEAVRYAAGGTAPADRSAGTGVPLSGTPSQLTVDGLTTGTKYSFSVFVQTAAGWSPAVTVSSTPVACPDLTPALDAGSLVTGQSWVACAGAGAHAANLGVGTLLPLTGSTQAVMTSGSAAVAQPGVAARNTGTSLKSGLRGALDVSIYRIDLAVPQGASCLQLDYAFGSQEYPKYIGHKFNDGFLAQLDQNTWSIARSELTAAGNFAALPDSTFVSVNGGAFADPAKVRGRTASGTSYGGTSVPFVATTPITPGAHSIYLTVFDAGDDLYDSGVLLDHLRTSERACAAGSNIPPSAADDTATTTAGSATEVDVLANDVDPDWHTLQTAGSTPPAHGEVTCSRTCTYRPAPHFTGQDSFTYTVDDGHGGLATANVAVQVDPAPPAPPVAGDDETTTDEDTPVTLDPREDDTDINDDALVITSAAPGAGHGSVSCTAAACTYTPAADYHGPDAFEYVISDGNGGTDVATVSVTVSSVNDAPDARDDAMAATAGLAKEVAVLADDTDVEGDTLAVSAHSDGAHGAVSCTTTTCTYTALAGYAGPDSFTYTADDGRGGTDVATVSVVVSLPPPDLAVQVTGSPASLLVGQLAGWTTAVRNAGGSPSVPTTLTVVLPQGLTLRATPAGCSVAATTLSCPVPSLAAGATSAVRLDGALTRSGTATLVASVTPPAPDRTPNNSASLGRTAVGRTCTVLGTFGSDDLRGGPGTDVLCGLSGNDTLDGGPGYDTLYGNDGNDVLDGNAGNDTLDGGPGKDTGRWAGLATGVHVNLAAGTATGQGTDVLASLENATGSAAADTIVGTSSPNVITGSGGSDVLLGAGGDDRLLGGSGNDVLDGGLGNDVLQGFDGRDTARYSSLGLAVRVDLSHHTATGQGDDTLTGIENVTGSSAADRLIGNELANILMGLSGNDLLVGYGGNDTLSGSSGNDTLNGGQGTDTCLQGTGTGTRAGCP